MIDTPTEIYASIIEHFISAHAEPTPNNPTTPKKRRETKFIPRGYLTPLLRVSKQWYANSAKYLYRSIAVGSPRRLPGNEIAKALHRTLKANPELAALVERLQLGMGIEPWWNRGEWTQANIDILQLCSNVVHVQIQGYDSCKSNALLSVVGEKSLVSFSISSRWQNADFVDPIGESSNIFDLIQNWPKLRSLQMQGGARNQIPLEQYQTSGFCPDLREIEIINTCLCPTLYKALRTMCSGGVKKFSVWIDGEVPHELCECLRAWSPTLEYLRVDNSLSFCFNSKPPNLPTEALSTLTNLWVLELEGLVVGWGVISNLPKLERICMHELRWGRSRNSEHVVPPLSTLLKNSEKFPSLTHIAGSFAYDLDPAVTNESLNICRGRDIQLGYDYPAFQTLLNPTHRRWSI